MKVAIVGAPQVGKTSLFGALTRQEVKVGLAAFQTSSQIAVVEVPDRRVDRLVQMYQPRKQTRAAVEFIDGGARPGTGGAFGPEFLQQIRQSDALVAVVRAFHSPAVPDPEGGLDAVRDYRNLEAELVLADLDLVEKRLERMEKQDRSKPKSAQGGVEKEALLQMKEHLERELPLSALRVSPSEEEALRHLEFVSRKPFVVVANIGEDDLESQGGAGLEDLQQWAERSRTPVVPICAAVELEVAQLGPEEEAGFLEALGVSESGRDRLIRTVYELLGLISFFTVGEDEVRAWTIQRGDNAVTAAGKIHTDLARGFIRAEVVPCAALLEAGSEKAARDRGVYRLETKPYVVQDGDILNIRFSV
jgi:GTP-binding protein YchF